MGTGALGQLLGINVDTAATKSSLCHAIDALRRCGLPNVVCDLQDPGDQIIRGGVTRRDILPVDVTAGLKNQMILLRGNIGGSDETPRRGTEDPGKDDKLVQLCSERGQESGVRSVLCGRHALHLAVGAFGVTNDVLPPDQGEEAGTEKNQQQRAPRIFMESGEEPARRMVTLLPVVVDAAAQQDAARFPLYTAVPYGVFQT